MAYGLRATYFEKNHNDVNDYLYLYQDGYSGSVLSIDATTGFNFRHQEITSSNNNGFLNPTFNKILMGVLDWNIWGKDTDTKQLIEDIKTGTKKEFYIQWMQGNTGNVLWQGYASGRILSFPEKEKYLAKLQFKDFEVAKSQQYVATDTRQTVIQTICDLIDQLGLNSGRYTGYIINTFTSWQAYGTTLTDDFLNQVYHDTIQLRNFGRQADENDTNISIFDALQFTAAPQLLIYQMNGAFNVVQLSAFEDGQNVTKGAYRTNGDVGGAITVNLEENLYTDKDLGLPVVTNTTQVTTYPALQSATFEFDHKSLDANITVPQTVTIQGSGERKFTMNVQLTGDESIVFTTQNLSRVTVPYSNYDTFTNADVNISVDTIDIPGLNIDQKVRFENISGTLPGGLSAGVTYFAKPYAGNDFYFDTFPNRLSNPVDITSTGATGSSSKVLTIEEVTLKNAEFGLTLGTNFLDSGVGKFITPGLSYSGMSSTIIYLNASNYNTTTDIITSSGHGLKDGQLIIFTNNGTMPGGLDELVFYYVVNSTTNTFQVSDTYNGTFINITTVGSGAQTVQRASMSRGLTETLQVAEYVGNLSFEITDLEPDQTVELNLHLFPTRVLTSEIASGFIDETLWLDTVVQFIDPSNPESTSILYNLEQNTAVALDVINLPAVRYGDGPYIWSRSAYRTSTNLADITTGWKRRNQASYVAFQELLLKEVLDTQRSRPIKLNANIIGDYNPVSVSVYETNYYAYVGGTYSGRWKPTLVQINIQTGSDTLSEVKKVDQSGNQGTIVTPPVTEGLTTATGDGRYLRIINDLGDVNNAGTARANLDLGTSDTPQFAGATLTDSLTISSTGSAVLRITNTNASQSWMQYVGSNDDFIIRDETDSRTGLIIQGNGDVIIPSGNVGININTPSSSYKLDVNGAGHFVNDLILDEDLVVANNIYLTDTNTALLEGGSNSVRIQTDSGYIEIGPKNSFYSHIETDRDKYYINKKIVVDSGIVDSYDEDLQLRRAESSADKLTIKDNEFEFNLAGSTHAKIEPDGKLTLITSTVTSPSINSGASSTEVLRIESGDLYINSSHIYIDNATNIDGDLGVTGEVTSGTLVIDTTGTFGNNVGIGTTSINAVGSRKTLHIDDSSGSAIRLSESSTDLAFLSYDSTSFFRLSSSDQISFLTAGSERMRILSSGGITFNGDTATANALDDYEEGTHTTTLTDGTYTAGLGDNELAYTKVGNMVTITGQFFVGVYNSNATESRVSLPFVIANKQDNSGSFAGTVRAKQLNTSNTHNVVAFGDEGASYVLLQETVDNGNPVEIGGGAYSSGTEITLNFSYFTT